MIPLDQRIEGGTVRPAGPEHGASRQRPAKAEWRMAAFADVAAARVIRRHGVDRGCVVVHAAFFTSVASRASRLPCVSVGVLVAMPMMEVGIVRVPMHERLVLMPMTVRFG